MSKKSPKKSRQAHYRRTTFKSGQYWNINYTERYATGNEKDFKTIILAKSYELAIHILRSRLEEDDPNIKIKAVQGFMFHKTYHSATNGRLGIKEWEQIRKSAFPNENNFLFKVEIPREEGKTNRFNKTDYAHLKSIGFSKGESNWSKRNRKGKVLPLGERTHKIWKGHWVPWNPSLRQATKDKLVEALLKNNNNRSKAAKYLGVHRNKIYKLFKKFPEIDWRQEYPPPPPPGASKGENHSKVMRASMKRRMENGEVPFSFKDPIKSEKKRVENLKKSKKAKRDSQLKFMTPKIDEALKEAEGSRKKAAKILNLSISAFGKLLRATRNRINWYKKYPSKFSRINHETDC